MYSGTDAAGPSAAAYMRSALPFFLIEAYYEHENGVSPAALRGESYGALLAGAKSPYVRVSHVLAVPVVAASGALWLLVAIDGLVLARPRQAAA
jgi:hypothetical protein